MLKPLRIIPDNPNIPFLKLRFPALWISLALVLTSLALCFTPGLNFGIDFRGGILIEAKFAQMPDEAALRTELGTLGLGQITLQQIGADPSDVMFRIAQQPNGDAGNQAAN